LGCPYEYSLPICESYGLRLWTTNSSSRDGHTVEQGGDFLPPGDYTVSEGGTTPDSTPVDVGNLTIDLSNLYLEYVGPTTIGLDITVKADVLATTLSASSVQVSPWQTPEVIIMRGWLDKGWNAMGAIRDKIGQELWAKDPVLAESVGIQVASVSKTPGDTLEEAYSRVYNPYVEPLARHNWLQGLGYFGQRSPIILIGFSDGATCVRDFALKLRKDYPLENIDYVGMIDLVRFGLGWTFPDDGEYVKMKENVLDRNNILFGNNFYERSFALFPLGIWPPWSGHRVEDIITIHNVDMTTLENGKHPNHLDMPDIQEVQDTIAYYAAWSYVGAFGLLNELYGS
jgi:hypothetical protein